MNDVEKKYIDIFINKCEKYDESVEVKGVSVGEESRILDTVVKYLKSIEKQQKEIEELKKDNNHQWEERCRLTFDIEKDIKLLQELLEEE